MTNDELHKAANAFRSGLSAEASALFEYLIDEDWFWDKLSRALLLAGGRKPLFSDMKLEQGEAQSYSGSIVLITEAEIIKVTFDDPVRSGAVFAHKVIAESVPRAAVSAVRADVVEGQLGSGGEWPRAVQLTIQLDRELAASRSLTLPAGGPARRERALALAAVVGYQQ